MSEIDKEEEVLTALIEEAMLRPLFECWSCKSGPFIARDLVSDPDGTRFMFGSSRSFYINFSKKLAPLSAAEPGKPASVDMIVRVTRHMVQTQPMVFRGTPEEAEAAGWEQDEYERWTCKSCKEKADRIQGGAHAEDENATLLIARDLAGVEALRETAADLIAEVEAGRPLRPDGLLGMMMGNKVAP